MGLDDLQLSLIQGLAVSLPVAALSIPVGHLVDRQHRVRLFAGLLAVSVVGLAMTAVADSFTTLFLARMLAGTGGTTGKISGSGLLGPGNSPGILTASQVDVTAGLDFALIHLKSLKSPAKQQRVLLVGVVLALVLRGAFIAVGAAALHAFTFTFVIFGAILLWTGVGLLRHGHGSSGGTDSIAVRILRRFVPTTESYHGDALTVRISGVRHVTPLLVVMVAVAGTDVLFALDSIPATFGVTTEPYLVFTANAFALLGLRALYFLLADMHARFSYLQQGLAIILAFVGVKMIVHDWYHIPTWLSLAVIGIVLLASIGFSLRVRSLPDTIEIPEDVPPTGR